MRFSAQIAQVRLALLVVISCMADQSLAQQTQAAEPEKPLMAKSFLRERTEQDSKSLRNPFAITQHKRNYLMPFSYAKDPNTLGVTELNSTNVDRFEAKYQVSVKLPIYLQHDDGNPSGLYMGFTALSFWQVYNSEASKPFRETNYEPEIFYSWDTEYSLLGFEFNEIQFGFNHQSNGQSGLRSRSWNRIFASALFSDEDSLYYFKTWYRIKEDGKIDPFEADGDDNPDITHYLGHFELGYGKKIGNFNLLALVRNNLKLDDNKGSVELSVSYPMSSRYDIVVQYFNGYGDSLIEYNRHQYRISLGIQLKFL